MSWITKVTQQYLDGIEQIIVVVFVRLWSSSFTVMFSLAAAETINRRKCRCRCALLATRCKWPINWIERNATFFASIPERTMRTIDFLCFTLELVELYDTEYRLEPNLSHNTRLDPLRTVWTHGAATCGKTMNFFIVEICESFLHAIRCRPFQLFHAYDALFSANFLVRLNVYTAHTVYVKHLTQIAMTVATENVCGARVRFDSSAFNLCKTLRRREHEMSDTHSL